MNIQLANTYNSTKDYGVTHFWASPKYDGVRCFYKSSTPDTLYSRTGEEFIGFNKIIEELKIIVSKFKENSFLKDKDIFLDGELYTYEYSFSKIQSIVCKRKDFSQKDKDSISLVLFAWGPIDDDPIQNTDTMVDMLLHSSVFNNLTHVFYAHYTKVKNSPEDIEDLTNIYLEEGYEGICLRHPTIAYHWKRSNCLLKYKKYSSIATLKIQSLYPGKPHTKYEHCLGGMLCTSLHPDHYTISCNVGSGFTDAERREIWANPDMYLGKEIELQHQGITKNSRRINNFSLRFPVKKNIKIDR